MKRFPRGFQCATSFLLPAALIVLAGCESASTPSGESGLGKLDGDWQLRNVVTAAKSNLSAHKGKVIFLNIWGTWCPPCVAEMPSIARLHDKFKDNPAVSFILVAINDEPEKVLSFLEDKGYKLPAYTPLSSTPSVLSSEGVPATFLIGPDSVVRLRHIGSYDWDNPATISQIEELAKSAQVATGG